MKNKYIFFTVILISVIAIVGFFVYKKITYSPNSSSNYNATRVEYVR